MHASGAVCYNLFINWEDGVSSVALPWPWLVFAFLPRPEPDPECAAAPERDEGSFLSSKEKAMQPGLELCRSGAEWTERLRRNASGESEVPLAAVRGGGF